MLGNQCGEQGETNKVMLFRRDATGKRDGDRVGGL